MEANENRVWTDAEEQAGARAFIHNQIDIDNDGRHEVAKCIDDADGP